MGDESRIVRGSNGSANVEQLDILALVKVSMGANVGAIPNVKMAGGVTPAAIKEMDNSGLGKKLISRRRLILWTLTFPLSSAGGSKTKLPCASGVEERVPDPPLA